MSENGFSILNFHDWLEYQPEIFHAVGDILPEHPVQNKFFVQAIHVFTAEKYGLMPAGLCAHQQSHIGVLH